MTKLTSSIQPAEHRDTLLDLLSRNFLTSGMLGRPLGEDEIGAAICVDIQEGDQAFHIQAELPGVKKDDVEVSIDRDIVTIRAEVRRDRDEKNDKFVRRERYFGTISRGFRLTVPVDAQGATATFDDGVLQLTLPKKPGSTVERIAIR